jgi:hypothetical protein
MFMTLEHVDLVAAAGRYPFHLGNGLAVVAMQPIPGGVVVFGWFLDGELLWMVERGIGEA